MFRPSAMAQLTTAFYLLEPKTTKVNGVTTKTFTRGNLYKCNFKTYGGSEKTINDLIAIEDTATITCWYDPAIQSGCRIEREPDGAIYEIINEPENMEMRNMYMQFKVRRIKGGA